jgi:hypothetical protein
LSCPHDIAALVWFARGVEVVCIGCRSSSHDTTFASVARNVPAAIRVDATAVKGARSRACRIDDEEDR